ncbi:hypothetical protein [Mucilaginibacter ginkgonis]|uniref:Uncharacterized protein n=1 Tax=Mucilaginibacter ginkgonis TaxID=2682091 RepID=A0A6I4I5D7_9SPHI|nr:hypothetical protein [Mucilaginibacter ginkgonis]QQL48387.1 hypothetical protein GO620_009285 [Mucilaginibacter ginkgonis]
MKNFKLIICGVAGAALFSACNGDHATRSGIDTASATAIGPNYDVRTNIDTSKTTNGMGDATLLDNTASGGVLVVKDTTHMKVRSVAVPTSAPATAATPAPADSTAAKK